MKALVTGGGGFVGAVLVKMLRERGEDVRVLARGDYPALKELGAETVRGDIGDASTVRKATNGCDVVFHVAAKAGVWGATDEYERINIDGTQNVIDACVAEGVERLVYTSSSSVTFHGKDVVNGDEKTPYPSSHLYEYGRTKAEAERRVLKANATPHKGKRGTVLLTTSLRTPIILGVGDPHLWPRMATRAKAGKVAIVGDGNNQLDLTFVENAAHAHLLAADALAAEKAKPAGKAYFISNGAPVTFWPWVNTILREVGLPQVTRRVPFSLAYGVGAMMELAWGLFKLKGEPLMTRFLAAQLATTRTYDLAAARSDLGYEPIIDQAEGERRIVQWLKDEIKAGRI